MGSFCAIALLTATPAGAGTALSLGTVHYPPYSLQEPDDDRNGIDIDVIKQVFRDLEYTVAFRFMPWARAVEEAKLGKLSGLVSCGNEKKRRAHFVLSEKTSQTTQSVMVRQDYHGPAPKRFSELRLFAGRIGVMRGYTSETQLVEAGIPHIKINTPRNGLRMLLLKRITALWTTKEAAQFLAEKQGRAHAFKFFTPQDVSPFSFHLCLSKALPDHETLIHRFNRGLARLKASGAYDAILDRYR